MCGIVAAVSPASNIVPVLLEGLRKLEYRGYDSAGIAVLNGAEESGFDPNFATPISPKFN